MPLLSATLALTLGGASAPTPAAARLHPGAPIWCELDVSAEALVLSIHGEPEPLAQLLGVEERFVGPFDPGEEERLARLVQGGFAADPRLEVDGEPVQPELTAIVFPEDLPDEGAGWLVVDVAYRLPLRELPRSIRLVWKRYEGAVWGGQTYVPVTVNHGRVPTVASVWPDEPEFVWHAPARALEEAPVASLPAPPEPAPRWRLPLASLAALAAGGLAALWVGRRRAPAGRRAWAAVGLVLLGGAVAWPLRATAVVSLGERVPEAPTDEEALAVFDRLHAGVYRAFEARTEEEIYERLRASVAPALVDPLYVDVYESLVMREQGGAVCAVERVVVQERRVRFTPDHPGFEVEAAWDVHGIVSHWGHVHRRTNTYRARHVIAAFPAREGLDGDGGSESAARSWKIAAVEVLEHERIDQDVQETIGE